MRQLKREKKISLKKQIKPYNLMENKKQQFTDDELEQLAQRFKILSESSRLKILRSLFNGEKCVTQIVEETNLLQANASKQLKVLNESGIIKCRKKGLQRFYSVNDDTVIMICNVICKNRIE